MYLDASPSVMSSYEIGLSKIGLIIIPQKFLVRKRNDVYETL